jgi:hypothetical protein
MKGYVLIHHPHRYKYNIFNAFMEVLLNVWIAVPQDDQVGKQLLLAISISFKSRKIREDKSRE